MIRLLAFAALLLSFATAEALAQSSSAPPDVIVLNDGSMFRGTLMERTPERVVLMLLNGETRTWSSAEVQFAGRDTALGEPALIQASPDVPSERPIRVHVSAPLDGLSLHVLETSTEFHIRGEFFPRRLDSFRPFCVAPCEETIAPGTYVLGIGYGGGEVARATDPIEIDSESWLELEYEDRSDTRMWGWIAVFVGPALGAGLGAIAAGADWFEPEIAEVSVIMIGLGIGTVIGVIGAAYAATNDHRAVRVRDHQ